MMKNSKGKPIGIFLIAEAVLYVLILLADWVSVFPLWVASGLKYAAILGCLGMAIVWRRAEKQYSILQVWCFVFTVIADFLLLFIEDTKWLTVGVISFLVVQILYMERLWKIRYAGYEMTLDEKRMHVYIRGIVAAVIVVVLRTLFQTKLDLLLVAVIVYISFFAVNLVDAGILLAKRKEGVLLLFLGLLLFFLCDINVGLSNLGAYFPADMTGLLRAAVPLMWTFYLPSQVVLVLSGGHGDAS